MIQNGIARFDVAQQIDQRNLIGLRTRQRPQNEVEIGCGKTRPTIRSNHRDCIMNKSPVDGKQESPPYNRPDEIKERRRINDCKTNRR
jgi:hypothetical protein